jgi:hypothetical protein
MSESDHEVTPPDGDVPDPPSQPEPQEAAEDLPQAKKSAAKKTSKRSSSKSTDTDEKNYTSGEVHPSDLKMGTKDSDSVRRLQTALGANVTGNYDRSTQLAVRSWQKRHGFDGGRGLQVGETQAKVLFGSGDYTII